MNMHTKYHRSRSLLAGFLAVVMLVSLVPAASAAQQNSYHAPAETWKEALDRTNELDAILSSIVLQSIPVQGKRR